MAYFRDKFRSIFQVKDSPHRVAMAFALGVFMGISPFLGLHYIGGICIAWIWGLNRLVAIVGVSVSNPWTIVPISTFAVWIGGKLLGIKQVLPEVDWENISLLDIAAKFRDMETFLYLVKTLWPLIASFFVGSFFLCTLLSVMSYFIIKSLVIKYRKVPHAP